MNIMDLEEERWEIKKDRMGWLLLVKLVGILKIIFIFFYSFEQL
jgi:hypothetical protein